jgi:hypothetical protein
MDIEIRAHIWGEEIVNVREFTEIVFQRGPMIGDNDGNTDGSFSRRDGLVDVGDVVRRPDGGGRIGGGRLGSVGAERANGSKGADVGHGCVLCTIPIRKKGPKK